MSKCTNCGVDRKITLVAKVKIGSITLGYKRMCMLCLLENLNLYDVWSKEVNYTKAMERAK